MNAPFGFTLETRVRVGDGVAFEAVDYAEQHDARRVAALVDAGLSRNEHAQELISRLETAVPGLIVLENEVAEPDYDYLDEFRNRVPADLDLLVAMGGGSTLDLAKAVSVLATNPGPAISYRGFDLIEKPGIPLVALPTTAGTGSEVTPNAVFTDRREQRKLGINTSRYLPRLALLDPRMTVSCPRAVTVSAGMDALVHSVESYVAQAANPLTRIYSREAFELVMRHLPVAAEQPEDLEARSGMQLAALIAGAALMNSGAGPAGALSYPLGAIYGVPHGLAGAVFLARVAEWNVERGADVYAGLAGGLPQPPADGSADERAVAVARALRDLSDRLDVPRTLEPFGVSRDKLPEFVDNTMLLEGALLQNPVPVDRDALTDIVAPLCV